MGLRVDFWWPANVKSSSKEMSFYHGVRQSVRRCLRQVCHPGQRKTLPVKSSLFPICIFKFFRKEIIIFIIVSWPHRMTVCLFLFVNFIVNKSGPWGHLNWACLSVSRVYSGCLPLPRRAPGPFCTAVNTSTRGQEEVIGRGRKEKWTLKPAYKRDILRRGCFL